MSIKRIRESEEMYLETILLLPTTKTQFVSSSAVKELVTFHCDISKYVPKPICRKILEKFKQD